MLRPVCFIRSFIIGLTLSIMSILVATAWSGGALASTLLVDTGAGSGPCNDGPGGIFSGPGCTALALTNNGAGSYQFLAGEISFNSDTSIDSVAGWMSTRSDGAINVALYNNVSSLPGTLMYSSSMSVSNDAGTPSFKSVAGLNWNVAAGTYWVAFEPMFAGPDVSGIMPGNVPSPLAAYAFANDLNPTYSLLAGNVGTSNLGIRVTGTSISSVPLPSAVWLLGSGLLALIGMARSKTI